MRPVARWEAGFWLAGIGTLTFIDVCCSRPTSRMSPLSAVTRWAFRTHTTPGRIAFVIGWAALTAWFIPHICRTPTPR